MALPGLWAQEGPGMDQSTFFGKVVKEIRIEGLRRTKRAIVVRELASRVGEPYLEKNARKDPERLDRLRVFSESNIEVLEEPDGVILVITVRETYPYLPTLSIDVSAETGASLGPGFRSVNMFGSGISLAGSARFGGATDVSAFLENPWFAGNHASYRIDFKHLQRKNKLDNFDEDSTEASLRLGSYLGEKGRVGVKFGLLTLASDVADITLSENNRDWIPTLGFFLGFDSRDFWTNPQDGWWAEAEGLKRSGFLGGDGDYWTFNLDIRRFQPITGRHSLGLFSLTTFQTGRVGENIPTHQDFHLGGTNTIRGWGLNSSIGKNQFINTIEYDYLLMRQRSFSVKGFIAYIGIQLAAFTDFGIAWNEVSEFKADSFLTGIGFGVRFLVPFVDVIRVDFAYGEAGRGLRSHVGVTPKYVKQRERVR
jgi:outer membrane protein assembly factor BamA